MKYWPTKPLTEVATVIRGVSFDKSQVSDEPRKNTVPVLRAGNIQESLLTDTDLVYVSDKQVSDEQRMRRGDLAICMSSGSPAIVGKSAHLETDWDGSVGAFCAIVRFNEKLHHRFGSYWFRSPAFMQWRDNNAKGANIQNLRRTELESLSIPVPPLAEQDRILKLLDEVDDLRKLRAHADHRVTVLIPALFHEMFGDPTNESKQWPMTTLGQVCTFIGGASLPSGVPFTGQLDGLLLLKVGDMNEPGNETFITTSREWIDSNVSKYSRAPKGTVVIPKRGGAIATNKKRLLLRDALLDPNLMGVCANEEKLNLDYLFEWFRQFDLTRISSGSTVPQLNKQDLSPLRIAIPPMKLQIEFAQRVTEIREFEASQATSRTRLDALFQSMLHRAFNGEL
jgi:type I restriction enzyme S subunit